MAMLTNLDLIRRVPLFAMLTIEQAAVLADAAVKRRFKRGELMVEQGQKSDSLLILLAGRARVVMADGKSREVILATLQPGDYVGEMSMIDNQPHSASVEAEIQSDVLILGRTEFTNCLAGSGSMAYAMIEGLVQRLRNADEQIGSLALLGVYDRVAKVLVGWATSDDDHRMVIREKISRQDIAKMVGASREMVSRVIRDLEENGFIEMHDGGTIVVNERRTVPR